MNRLDRHVAAVQTKLFASRFADALAWTMLAVAGGTLGAIVVSKLFRWSPPLKTLWFALGAAAVAALVWAIIRRADRNAAAVAIDEKLSLKEKFSTALFMRGSGDPVAKAAVLDAERTADRVNLAGQFKVQFPRSGLATIAVAAIAVAATLLPQWDLLKKEEVVNKQNQQIARVDAAKKAVRQAMVTVDSVAAKAPASEAVKIARSELAKLENDSFKDPQKTQRTAAKILQDMNDALKNQVAQTKAQNEHGTTQMKALGDPSPEDKGPIADARRELAKGNYDAAMEAVKKAVEDFDKMDKKEQEDTAKQMQQVAAKLQQMANDKQVQQQMQQQMQQAGMSQQQAQQMTSLMQQAANGNPQAAQQLQQAAQQAMGQMNNGQGPNTAQQQAIQQAMAQAQGMASAQCQAGQLSQGAQQMAQAMQQAASGNNQGAQSQMANAAQGVQQALQNMQAAQQGAGQTASAQQTAQQGADAAAGQCAGGQGTQGDKDGNKQAGGTGQWAAGDPNKQGAGQGGPGIGQGGEMGTAAAPHSFEQKVDKTNHDPNGKILAATLVKDKGIKGDMKSVAREVAAAGKREQTDEVDDTRVDARSREAARRYFSTMEDDAGKK